MTDKKIIDLLKSGNFTIAYHDNGQCGLYKGKLDYDDLPEKEERLFEGNHAALGYAPEIVCILVEALGGKIDSI